MFKNTKYFFHLNMSSGFVFIFGILSFLTGCFITDIPDRIKDIEDNRLRLLVISFIVGIPTTAFKYSDSMISRERDAILKDCLREKDEDHRDSVKKAVQEKMEDYNQELGEIKALVAKEKLTPEIAQSIGKRFANIEVKFEKFESYYKTAKEVTSWLNEKVDGQPYANRRKLLTIALKSTDITKLHIRKMFDNDIQECIHWLHDSLLEPVPCLVNGKTHASALVTGILKSTVYEDALNAIRGHIKQEFILVSSLDNKNVVDEMIDHLIQEIQTIGFHQ